MKLRKVWMKIEKNSTEIIQEYMVYYLNGERFASSTMQGGKRAYTIENYDRRLYVENSKDIFSKEKENILDKLDIGTLMYENLVHSLKVVGTVKRVLISMILQKHKYVFEKEKTDMINNVFAEVNVTYMLDERIIPVVRRRKVINGNICSALQEIVKSIVEKYKNITKLKIRNLQTAKYNVILCPGQGGVLIHEGIGHNLEGDIYFKKESLLNNMLKKKIFNKQINISDSCNEIDYIYYNLSSDGSVTQNVDLVKNGVINGLLSDMYISSCYGVEDTGNGRCATFENMALPRMRNTYLHNGEKTANEIIDNMREGIIALELGGGSVDIVSGHFVFNIALGGYNDIRKKLIERGIPESEVKFIHEADTDMKKKELFQKTRKGEVRVLLGSTQKMGAGTNVQDKLIALHDVDCPWRPSDLEQRSGRIVRQGNENPQVDIYRYVTEQTFDASVMRKER